MHKFLFKKIKDIILYTGVGNTRRLRAYRTNDCLASAVEESVVRRSLRRGLRRRETES